MSARRFLPGLLVLAALAATVLLITGGPDPYRVHVPMSDAGGLREGADVAQGGVKIGTLDLDIGKDDAVDLTLKIDREHAPIPQDATVALVANNLLGQKHVEIVGGTRSRPAEDGATLRAAQLVRGTDLDEVLDVLDADTRTRLAIFLNEAGNAFAGRKQDLRQILRLLPRGLAEATETVRQLVTDNRSLGSAVDSTSRFVATMSDRRNRVGDLVGELGQATQTLASRRVALRRTLAVAPRTLTQLRGFLADLEQTTVPLGPAARQISASSPLLSSLLDEVEPLRAAAEPTLRTATKVAPRLTDLGVQATPVIRRALPTAGSLTRLAQTLPPLTRTLDKSSHNIFATVDNWTRAIQFRDGMGHVFRGEAAISPDLLLSALDRLAPAEATRRKARPVGSAPPTENERTGTATSPPAAAPDGKPAATLPAPVKKILDGVIGQGTPLGDAARGLTDGLGGLLEGGAGKATPDRGGASDPTALLDYLLGK